MSILVPERPIQPRPRPEPPQPPERPAVETPATIGVGDVVTLRSGGPPMTVERVRDGSDGAPTVACVRRVNGKPHAQVLPAAALAVVEPRSHLDAHRAGLQPPAAGAGRLDAAGEPEQQMGGWGGWLFVAVSVVVIELLRRYGLGGLLRRRNGPKPQRPRSLGFLDDDT